MAPEAVRLRPCRLTDIAAVLALRRHAGAAPRPTGTETALARRLERDADLFVLAWDGSRLVGTLLGGWDGWRGNMYRLVVDPLYRRRGVGRRLVEAVEQGLRARGAERITSLVFIDEPRAAEFWQSRGYARDPATQRFA